MKFIFLLLCFTINTASFSSGGELDEFSKSSTTQPLKMSTGTKETKYFAISMHSIKDVCWRGTQYITMFLALQNSFRTVDGFNFTGEGKINQDLAQAFTSNWRDFTKIIDQPSMTHIIGQYAVQVDQNSIPFVSFKRDYKTHPYYTYEDIASDFMCCEDQECAATPEKNIKLSKLKAVKRSKVRSKKNSNVELIEVESDFKPWYEGGFMCSYIKNAILYFKVKNLKN